MARRRRMRSSGGEVELNVAAMLDMAFQLLTFFILTFRPAPVEGQINLRLPPPMPVVGGKAPLGREVKADEMPASVKTLVISVFAWPKDSPDAGKIQSMRVGETDVGTVEALADNLEKVFSDETNPFEQVLLQATSNLRYDQLMKVVDECTKRKPVRDKLKALSFVEVPLE